MRKLIPIVAALLVLQACPAFAAAAQTLPPDNSAIDQYTENLPGAGGDRPAQAGGSVAGGGGGSVGQPNAVLSPPTQAKLNRLGKNGRAAARAAEATGPSPGTSQQTGSNPPGSSGFGFLLPLLLVLSLIVAAGVYFARSRREGPAA